MRTHLVRVFGPDHEHCLSRRAASLPAARCQGYGRLVLTGYAGRFTAAGGVFCN
jgi:hypothetical protein